MQNFLLVLILMSLMFMPLYSLPPPFLHESHFVKRSLHLDTNVSQSPQRYFEVSRALPFDSLNASCSFPILSLGFGNTYGLPPVSVPYSPPFNCTWSNVVLEIQVSCQGEQYDRIAAVWLSGAELFRTSTAEPTEDGVFWSVRKDVSRYSPLLAQDNLTLSIMLENIVNDVFTGVYEVNVTFHYYDVPSGSGPFSFSPLIAHPGENQNYFKTSRKLKSLDNPANLNMNDAMGFFDLFERRADMIIPISSDGDDGFWFRIQNKSDIHSKRVGIPRNTYRAVIEIYTSAHGNDEFWYSHPSDVYLSNMRHHKLGQTNSADSSAEMRSNPGQGAYREILVKIDGNLVGSVIPFPVIFTGGINPLFWEPVVGIGAFDLPSYDLELTPFLGLLLDGGLHSFSLEVAGSLSFWLVDANLHLWLDAHSSEVQAGVRSSKPEFTLEHESKFDGLNGNVGIETERKTRISGWVNTTAGNFTTIYEKKLEFENEIRFYNNGMSKTVEQKVKEKSDLTIKLGTDLIIFHTNTKKESPLRIYTQTLPRENDTYMMVTTLKNSIEEKKRTTTSLSTLRNVQECSGWMTVKDHEVLSGVASTLQSYGFKEGEDCYFRAAAAENGTLIDDFSSVLCVE